MATRLTPNQVIEVRIFYLLPYANVAKLADAKDLVKFLPKKQKN